MCFAVSLGAFAQDEVNNTGKKIEASHMEFSDTRKAASNEPTVFEILSCPEGTVVGGSYEQSAQYVGYQNADMGRVETKTRFYQSFSGCYYNINALRFIGMFSYYDNSDPMHPDWVGCSERGGIAPETHKMTEPIKLEVKFYKRGKDGLPGEVVYEKIIDAIGNYNKIIYEKDKPLYEFTINLGEDIKLENGFFSIAAADLGDKPSCWLSLFCASSVPYKGYLQIDDAKLYEAWMPMCFCLKSDGTPAATKAMKVEDVYLPSATAKGKHEKVRVMLTNVGATEVNDTKLELWAGDNLVATETVDATIPALGGSYNYMFKSRIDCSAPGANSFEIRNVTPGDEYIANQSCYFETYNDVTKTHCQSQSTTSKFEKITSVKLGDINCESQGSCYTDNRDMKTTIKAGEKLTLEVKHNAPYCMAWVDWNDNGAFDEENECIGLLKDGKIDIQIPEGNVAPGEKLLRIIASKYMPSPCGEYDYGETEDYTVVVEYNNNAAVMKCNVETIDEVVPANSTKELTLEFGNEGAGRRLEGTITNSYILPQYPSSNYVFDKDKDNLTAPKMVMAKAPQAAANEPAESENTSYTMRYDHGLKNHVALTSNSTATYAQYYPAEMLENVSGMFVESIDINIATAPKKTTVQIFDQNTQTRSGKLLYSQEFTPKSNSWNHIDLTRQVEITGRDLWVGVKFEGIDPSSYCIGTDQSPALRGYGDIVNVGGDRWWSLGDLGIESNFCLRTNIGGKAAPAVNWLSMDNPKFFATPGNTGEVKVTLNTAGLPEGLYESVLYVNTNDELASLVRIPVFLTCGDVVNSINKTKMEKASLSFSDNTIKVTSDNRIARINLTDLACRTRRTSNAAGNYAEMQVGGLHNGIYILDIQYADGSHEAVKIPVMTK